MKSLSLVVALLGLLIGTAAAADFQPARQEFRQEIARHFTRTQNAPTGPVQLVECPPDGACRILVAGEWQEFRDDRWQSVPALKQRDAGRLVFAVSSGAPIEAPMPWREVRQILRAGKTNWLLTAQVCLATVEGGRSSRINLPEGAAARQIALSPDGIPHVASSRGLLRRTADGWQPLEIVDSVGRVWASREVLGVAFDSAGQLWFATKAGVGCQIKDGWKFYEGKDGLPWNDFTGITAGADGEVWFTTHLGVIRFDGREWHYRQGRRWLTDDDVLQVAIDRQGTAWLGTAAGISCLERQPMTLAAKAEFYEQEIERYIKRTPFGYVAEPPLRTPGDKSTAEPRDIDNDGLWTAMYGAGECFAYGATKDARALARAKQAFEALRFLQKVTQGCAHEPPKGFVARSIRPVAGPDPNIGQPERDRAQQRREPLWKILEPRWPKSADGQWYWKADTSSDELDGHFFFYPLYYDLCATNDAERARVREVVRDLADHLLTHRYVLIDHDGKPTRWGIFDPPHLNRDPHWWPERGLNSLSLLSYLAVAAHVTGEAKYSAASRELIEQHGYAHNAMYPKLQAGAGSGNQSDDEMAFMAYYSLLRCSTDEELKSMIRFSFFCYWQNEAPELNPFFNFAYASQNLASTASTQHRRFSLQPKSGWVEDSMATLYGLPLDRLNWAHRNSHRLDVVFLPSSRSIDPASPDEPRTRGHRVNGKVLPVENRFFTQWNTDPWRLDYRGEGNVLGAGTVFLLPYYMGLYHGYIQKPEAGQ